MIMGGRLKVNGLTIRETEKALKFTRMGITTEENLKTIMQTEKERITGQTRRSSKVNGLTVKSMGKEFGRVRMETRIWANGKTTWLRVTAYISGKTVISMKACGSSLLSGDKAQTYSQTATSTTENTNKVSQMAMASTSGSQAAATLATS
jgi:hypothetical protein